MCTINSQGGDNQTPAPEATDANRTLIKLIGDVLKGLLLFFPYVLTPHWPRLDPDKNMNLVKSSLRYIILVPQISYTLTGGI